MTRESNNSEQPRALQVNSIAPIVTLALLLVTPWYLGAQHPDEIGVASRHAEVRQAIENVPEKLGNWVSREDVVIPTGALDILNPNAHLSRRFQRIGAGRSVFATLMLIHCSDARDMIGHYPPVCYPRGGWTELQGRMQDFNVVRTADDRELVVRYYRFARFGRNGIERVITVADTFILPEVGSTVDMGVVINAASRSRRSMRGVAQIQVLFEGDVPNDIAESMIDELLQALPQSLFDVLMNESVLRNTGSVKETDNE